MNTVNRLSRNALPVLVLLASASTSYSENGTDGSTVTAAFEEYEGGLRRMVDGVLARIPPSFARKLQQAEVSTTCSIGLLKMMRGFRGLEPWALRLLDASGKYPTGLLQGTHSDLGAFDECLETTVHDGFGHVTSRGQYCSLLLYLKDPKRLQKKVDPFFQVMHPKLRYYREYFFVTEVPIVRLGICLLDDCSQDDLQALVNAVGPSVIDLQVSNCVTAEPGPWNTTQKGIMLFLCFLVTTVLSCTLGHVFMEYKPKYLQKHTSVARLITALSAVKHTQMLLKAPDAPRPDQCDLRFAHGIRFLSAAFIVLGHSYQMMSDTWSCLLNMFLVGHQWPAMIIAAGFNSVSTFFFLSGFFLCLGVKKQRRNGPLVFLIAVLRRLVRTCIPLAFIVMCLYMQSRIVAGPNTKTYFQKLRADVAEHWWHLLLQIRNLYPLTVESVLPHTWYLSTDFQLFIIALPTLLLLKSRTTLVLGAFTLLSLLCTAIATWTVYGTEITPFVFFPTKTPQIVSQTVNEYYTLPFYHAVCYFSGCMTYLVMDDFRGCKVPKVVQVAGWCVATGCALCCVFMKIAWFENPMPTSEAGKLLTAFFDRILWSFFLSWITLECGTGRGGIIATFLSWNALVPLSKLSFGVYLIHYPFLELMLHASRERRFWSHFNQVSTFFSLLVWSSLLAYLAHLACDGPTGALDQLAFSGLTGRGSSGAPRAHEHQPGLSGKDALPKQKLSAGDNQVVSITRNVKTNGHALTQSFKSTSFEQHSSAHCFVHRL